MRAIIVGANPITRQLVQRLGKAWDVTVVDPSEENLSSLKRERPLETLVGDGSSRVVLEEAGLEEADALVAIAEDDDRNIEICRIGLQAKLGRVMAVAASPERLGDYSALGVPAFSPSRLTARQLEPHLEVGRVSSKAFAGGKVEASEFRIAPNSPVRGMSVSELNGATRMVAAVLRGGRILIPNGEAATDLVLESDDLVTVVGPATDLAALVEVFTEGRARFPLLHGKRVAVVLEGQQDIGKAYAEALTITRNSRASSLLVVHPSAEGSEELPPELKTLMDAASVAAEGIELESRPSSAPAKALRDLPATESIGVLVLPSPPRDSRFGFMRAVGPLKVGLATNTPILFARGRHSYERIVVAARRTPSGRAAARAAIDIADMSKAEIVALSAVEPTFVAGPDAPDDARRAVQAIREEGALQGVEVTGELKQGNPLTAFLEASDDASLLVLGSSDNAWPFGSRLTNRLVHRSKASVLVVPAEL